MKKQPDPPNLRRYPSVPAADDREHELRERLRQERRDEERDEGWSNFDRDTGIRKYGPI